MQDVIEYRHHKFENPSPGVDTEYGGPPTPERNKKWEALHFVGETRLSKLEASRLHNKTAAAQPDTDEDYPVVLTVFHDLHCLVSTLFVLLLFKLLSIKFLQGRNSVIFRVYERLQMELYLQPLYSSLA